jgi:hypothetical protein
MCQIARGLGQLRPDLSITIIGATVDDIDTMRSSNAFVTGAVGAEEFKRVVAAHNLGRLFIGSTQPLFGHPIQSAAQSLSVPIAYFDWSRGRIRPNRKDLAIDPYQSLTHFIDVLSHWMPTL